MNKKHIFRGAATALVTPFRDGEVNYVELERLIEYQIAGGISAICVCATTGEAPTLEDAEHQRIIEFAARKINGRVPLIAGTGSNNTAHAVMMSRAAQSEGANALLCVTPYYNRATDAGLEKSFLAIADSVEIPIILYNVPGRTTVNVATPVYKRLARHPNICAVKEASGDIGAVAALFAECGGDLDVYSGNDDMTVPTLALGGAGVISVMSNLLPGTVQSICGSWFAGRHEEAARAQLRYMPLIRALFSEVNPIPVKTALAAMGFDTSEMRLPLCRMGEGAKARLLDEMERLGVQPSPSKSDL